MKNGVKTAIELYRTAINEKELKQDANSEYETAENSDEILDEDPDIYMEEIDTAGNLGNPKKALQKQIREFETYRNDMIRTLSRQYKGKGSIRPKKYGITFLYEDGTFSNDNRDYRDFVGQEENFFDPRNNRRSTLCGVIFGNNIKVIPHGVYEHDVYSLKECILPSELESIGSKAFFDCDLRGKLVLPPMLRNIGSGAFYSNEKLEEAVFLGNKTETIESEAFYQCGLKYLDLGDGEGERELEIKECAFSNNRISDIKIPQNTSRIGRKAFYQNGNLHTLTIEPGNVDLTIEDFAFKLNPGSRDAPSQNDFVEEIIVPSRVKKIGVLAFDGHTKLRRLIFRRNHRGEGVIKIDWEAFRLTGLKGVIHMPRSYHEESKNVFPTDAQIVIDPATLTREYIKECAVSARITTSEIEAMAASTQFQGDNQAQQETA